MTKMIQTGAKADRVIPEEIAARIAKPEFRAEERETRESLERERRELGSVATSDLPTEPEDAIALAKFIGGLRQRREQAGLSLTDVADRSGIDKASLSRLENGWYSNPTMNTLARYARAIGKRFVPTLDD
jgi:DNA-binding XRE family transcriptional regulator